MTSCSYPGARWWKFDFHTHTPVSKDTPWHGLMGTPDELTPEKWLLKYMAAEIDCVAITDHNSGAWVDKLKTAYAEMQALADAGQAPASFRPLTLFPGVEISVQGGVHVLAIFEPSATSSDIVKLLSKVDYHGSEGGSDGVTRKGIAEVIEAILASGAIPIPAHADSDKGLLQCEVGSNKSAVDTNTLRQALAVDGLLAVEWCDLQQPYPEAVAGEAQTLSRVLGSDCHNFRNGNTPGSRFTWVKMAAPPSLEGLRLALLDSNGISIRRSDDTEPFDPFKIPEHVITAIEVDSARYMGNGCAARIELSPYFNAVVGGRGSGKSTLVHALRLATRRTQELQALSDELWQQFEHFCQLASGREGKGALKKDTAIAVEWLHDGERSRLWWRADDSSAIVEEWQNGQWQKTASQSINAERFPIRIFSQGQIAAMFGGGRQTLLAIIDEAADIAPLWQAFEDARNTFFSQRAKLRELDGKLAGMAEVRRKLDEVTKKLATLAHSNHAAILQNHARMQRQRKLVNDVFKQVGEDAKRLAQLADELILDDWPSQYFDAADTDVLAWKQEMDTEMAHLRQELHARAQALAAHIETQKTDPRLQQWHARVSQAQTAHDELQKSLAEQGVSGPNAFTHLNQEQQQLEGQLKALQRMQQERLAVQEAIDTQLVLLREKRTAISTKRQEFLASTLKGNVHVRMELVPLGFEAQILERELRALLDVNDERFADDILTFEDGMPSGGMVQALAQASAGKKMTVVDELKQKLINVDDSYGRRFCNYLQRQHEKPEFADRILVWFPEDDLRIQYQRDGAWASIEQGSQGQRSAALLAFLLAFGSEPMVLDQPEDDLDNHLIYELIVRQIRENKLRRQLIVITHNPNVVVNGDAELVQVMDFGQGQCYVKQHGSLQERDVRYEVCRVMEGGREAFTRRWKRLGREV